MNNEELVQKVNTLQAEVDRLKGIEHGFEEFKNEFYRHKHNKRDGTQLVTSDIVLDPESSFQIGDRFAMGVVDFSDDINAQSVMGWQTAVGVKTLDAVGAFSRTGTQMNVQNSDTGLASFLYSFRGITAFNNSANLTITNGGTTITDTTKTFDTDELAGYTIYVNNAAGDQVESNTIASNTATVITVSNAWTVTTGSDFSYSIGGRVYLGSANFPWRRLYVNEIRLGEGGSSGTQVRWIKMGTGTPEGAVTANVGSIWLRTDGGAGTTLYVKESGTGNTGWVGK